MYHLAICDDHSADIEKAKEKIHGFTRKYHYEMDLMPYKTATALIDEVRDGSCYDIIFMDVRLPGMTGIDAAKELLELYPNCLIIMLTAYPQYALEALNGEVFRYVVKGRMDEMFEPALLAAVKRLELDRERYYWICSGRKNVRIACRDILYCYKKDKQSVIVTRQRTFSERKSLERLLKDLNQIQNSFLLVERAHLVNLQYVKSVARDVIILSGSSDIVPIGPKYLDLVRPLIDDYWRRVL